MDSLLPAAGPDASARRFRRLADHKKLLLAALVVLALAAAGLSYGLFGGAAGASYVTVKVTRGTVAQAVTATGSVNPVLTVTVGTYVSGVITEIACDFNTQVRKGQLCARIDPRPYQTVVDQDVASVETAKAQLMKDLASLDYAEVSAQRQAALLAKQATSQDNYDGAQNALKQARAQVALDRATIDQRSAQLGAAKVNLGYTDIVSPVNGIVVSRNVTVGQTVAASFQTPTLFLIATDLSRMEVHTSVSESDIGGIKIGDRAHFTVEAFPDRMFNGRVTQIRQAPQTVQNVVTYDVVVTVENAGGLLKPGMTATTRIVTAERDGVLRVPNQALRYSPGGLAPSGEVGPPAAPQLWLLRDGHPSPVAVTPGLEDDNFTEIEKGISEGDAVILSERTSAQPSPTRRPIGFP